MREREREREEPFICTFIKIYLLQFMYDMSLVRDTSVNEIGKVLVLVEHTAWWKTQTNKQFIVE